MRLAIVAAAKAGGHKLIAIWRQDNIAGQQVATSATVDAVITSPTSDEITAALAKDQVIPCPAVQQVVAVAAVDDQIRQHALLLLVAWFRPGTASPDRVPRESR